MEGVNFDAVIVGAGAAGLHCAGIAGQLGLRVLLIDHSPKVAEKIRISGGGRCNFTNRDTAPANFISANPHFCRSALARYTPQDFIGLLRRHHIGWHEKHKGQLFCDDSSEQVIQMLLRECETGGVTRWQGCAVNAVRSTEPGFELDTDRGVVRASRLVVATGGLSIPKIGASDFGYRLARQFGHKLIETRPALVPLTFDLLGQHVGPKDERHGAAPGLHGGEVCNVATHALALQSLVDRHEALRTTFVMAEGELLVTVPLKLEPSCNCTVACGPAAGALDLLQPTRLTRVKTMMLAWLVLIWFTLQAYTETSTL